MELMQHRDRQQFLAELVEVIEHTCGLSADEATRAVLSARLAPLLDRFLLESQAIVAAEATVLIADIRGFTSLVASCPPRSLIAALNRYFTAMGEIVKRHGGLIDKFMGDAVMALFGVPEAHPDDLLRALACAVEMQHAMQALNRRSQARGEPALYVGIAINTGQVMAGSFGSSVYSEYTAIGDTVNLAARIEGYSLRGQILLSEASRQAAGERIEIGSVNHVMVKGKTEPITLHELKAIVYPRRIEVPQIEIRKSPRVKTDLPLTFRRVEAKQVLPERFYGRANDLGYHGMNADLTLPLPPWSEIVINLLPDLDAEVAGDVYARVLRADRAGDYYRTNLEFTALGTLGHQKIKNYVDQRLWHR